MIGEKAETRELKQKLAGFFLNKDVEGARECFDEALRIRPDVMMEASDITGELRLSMQTIATARQEMQNYQTSILDHYQDYQQLMQFFYTLNRVTAHHLNHTVSARDLDWLEKEPVTELGIEISVLMQASDQKTVGECLMNISRDLEQMGKIKIAQTLAARAGNYELK